MHTMSFMSFHVIYDSDLGGEVHIKQNDKEIIVQGDDFKSMMAEFIRYNKKCALDDMEVDELLGIKK